MPTVATVKEQHKEDLMERAGAEHPGLDSRLGILRLVVDNERVHREDSVPVVEPGTEWRRWSGIANLGTTTTAAFMAEASGPPRVAPIMLEEMRIGEEIGVS